MTNVNGPGRPAISSNPKRKLTRAERNQKVKESLIQAAIKIVGEVGYANAMVSKITAKADVAQGTFYNHFESQQDLFDQLLPRLGAELLGFIHARSNDAKDAVERERLGFLAFFEFTRTRPEFYRILYEAELFAPVGYEIHMARIAEGYVRTLERGAAKGEIAITDRNQLEAIAFILMGARHYLCMRFARRNGRTVELPDWAVEAYLRLFEEGIRGPKLNASSDGL